MKSPLTWLTLLSLSLGPCCLCESVLGGTTEDLKIASFNVQVFGAAKAGKAEVMNTLIQIIHRYDIILIQEIRDVSGEAIQTLRERANKVGQKRYGLEISERLGRTTSKEQYAFLYRTDRGLSVTDTYQYPDPKDAFEREPFAVRFQSIDTDVNDFVLVGVHIDPDDAKEEIDALDKVHQEILQHWSTDNILILGDLNADCSYLSKSARARLTLKTDPQYHWLIDDDADTTTSASDCAYDRFIQTGAEFVAGVVPDSARVFHFDEEYGLTQDQAKAVSDHYPIELSLQSTQSHSHAHNNPGFFQSIQNFFSRIKIEL